MIGMSFAEVFMFLILLQQVSPSSSGIRQSIKIKSKACDLIATSACEDEKTSNQAEQLMMNRIIINY
jgi:hypothetical protein